MSHMEVLPFDILMQKNDEIDEKFSQDLHAIKKRIQVQQISCTFES